MVTQHIARRPKNAHRVCFDIVFKLKNARKMEVACYSLRQNQELLREAKLVGVTEKHKMARFSCGRTRRTRVPHACITACTTMTVEPRLNEALHNEVLGITNDIIRPSRSK